MTDNEKPNYLGSMEDVLKVFNKLDKNGDGKISSDELTEILQALGSYSSEEEVSVMMKEMDKDGDGFIDLDEFVLFHQAELERGHGADGAEDKDLKAAFDLYDIDKNGLISVTELHSVMNKVGEKVSMSQCANMIKNVDKDGDGHVNFEEFKKMMNG